MIEGIVESDLLNSISPFVRSSEKDVERMLRMANLKKGEILYDLGSGDGRIVIAAAKKYGVKAVGIELQEDLVKETQKKIHELGLEKDVKIIHGDLLIKNISKADVVTLYLTEDANEKLVPKLKKELKPGNRIISHRFKIPNWTPIKVNTEGPHKIYLYINKNSLT